VNAGGQKAGTPGAARRHPWAPEVLGRDDFDYDPDWGPTDPAASVAIAANVDIVLLGRMLGHKSAAMTLDLYGHQMPGQSSAMVERIDALIAESQVAGHPASQPSVAREERENNAQQHSSSENEKAPSSSATRDFVGGDDGNRTHDPLLAKRPELDPEGRNRT
jgi:hypothetical protein